ncbi:hypothetical protein JYT72_00920 [Crocinitomix catalasitica]|nr:hypothetical protein [Crocinitomix catalasitica]
MTRFTLLILLLSSLDSFAQRPIYISIEALGSGGFGSINFEREFYDAGAFSLQFRGGFSFTPVDPNNGSVLIFPVMVHGVVGKKTSRLDFGIGQSFSITTRGAPFVRMPLSLGYRIQPPEKRFYLRFSYTPIVSWLIDQQFEHWGGITFGFRINKASE